jgi:hypothetical protein
MFSTKVDTPQHLLTRALTWSILNEVPTIGLLWIQRSRDLDKIRWNGSHFKMTCHWDTYLTLNYIMDFSTLYALHWLVSLPQVF